jgi:hypothetical protein
MKKPQRGLSAAELRNRAERLRGQARMRLQRANELMAEWHELLREAESYAALAAFTEEQAARNEVAHG